MAQLEVHLDVPLSGGHQPGGTPMMFTRWLPLLPSDAITAIPEGITIRLGFDFACTPAATSNSSICGRVKLLHPVRRRDVGKLVR